MVDLLKTRNSIVQGFIIFLKGLFMGSADIIPGVSGGTIALITGIYERLVFALKSIDFKFIPYFFIGIFKPKYFKKAKKDFFGIDFSLLVPLALGVLVAFLSLANLISYFNEFFPTYMYAFFFGLILASAYFVYFLNRKLIKLSDIVFLFIGIIFGFFVVGLSSVQADHSFIIIFLSGMITFCAMILPGISGAFILLVLGQYEFLLDVLKNIAHLDFSGISYAISYIFGGIAGLLLFSRVLSFLFKRYHGATLLFIVGLMIGALRDPLTFVIDNPSDIFITVLSGVIGVLVVSIVSYYGFIVSKKNVS